MAIVDDTRSISHRLHQLKYERALVASSGELDDIGRDYAIGRAPAEDDNMYRARVTQAISERMIHAVYAAADALPKRCQDIQFVHVSTRRIHPEPEYKKFPAVPG